MKIKNIECEICYIKLKTPFITALRSVECIEFLRVTLFCDGGVIAVGEAPSTKAITGENVGSIEKAIFSLKEQLIALDLEDALKLVHKSTIGSSSKAALDMAIYSLLHPFVLENTQAITTDITISFNEENIMLKDALKAQQSGMHILKIKLAKDISHATSITRKLSQKLPKAKLLIDANQAWSLEETLKYIDGVKECKIELIEQPVIASDLESLKIIKEQTTIPILADEAVFTLDDVKRVMDSQSADMINIKLMKCGGVSKAIEILEYAKKHTISCMLGSMLEGPYSINAALYLAFNYRDVIKYVDLDSPLLYAEESKELDFKFDGCTISYKE